MQSIFGGKKKKPLPDGPASRTSSVASLPASRGSTSASSLAPKREKRKVEFDGHLLTTQADNDENFYEYMQKMRENIHIEGDAAGVEGVRWEDPGLSSELVKNLKNRLKYNGLLPLQERTIPILLHPNNYSILVQSPTGSGKTAAFGIPALQIAMDFKKKNDGPKARNGPSVIVVCNTQNLAMQIKNNMLMMAGGASMMNNTGISIFGLFNCGDDKYALRKDADIDIVVATMGNLINSVSRDFLETRNLKLLVVDEADKMTSLAAFGFNVEEFLRSLDPDVRKKLKVAAFSATYEQDSEGEIDYGSGALGELFNFTRPTEIKVEPVKGYIQQRIIEINETALVDLTGVDNSESRRKIFENSVHARKIGWLKALLKHDKEQFFIDGKFTKTAVIFVERIVTCNFLSTYLMCLGFQVLPLNSNYDLVYVNDTLKKMASGEIQAIVSTNKLARGQDIPDLHHVIIYEMSNDFSDYQHRIGRTGRIGHGGIATTLFRNVADHKHVGPLYSFMQYHNQKIPRWLHSLHVGAVEERNRIQGYYQTDDTS